MANDIDPTKETSYTINDYQPRTLRLSSRTSQRRRSFLPAYPTHKYDSRPPMLLLANVPNIDRNLMELLSYTGDGEEANLTIAPFKFTLNQHHEFIDSFLNDIYQKLYLHTSQHWKLSPTLIDYNLACLFKCMNKYSKQVGEAAFALLDELPIALEFYLQIDGKFSHNNFDHCFFISF